MKVAVLIPDRNDRPEFLSNCLRMINNQTRKPDQVLVINDPPISNDIDISYRYRMGYEQLRNKCDVIFMMENDDYYSPNYIEYMLSEWILNGRPDIFGTNHTIYYNLKLRAHFTMNHNSRSMAMSTLIKPNLDFKWCADSQPYTDIHLWNTIKNKKVIQPKELICMGIKHGIGKLGGYAHIDKFDRYINKDLDFEFLKSKLGPESFEFYKSISLKL